MEAVSLKLQELKDRIAHGEKIFLYETIYIPVDSIVNEEPATDEFSVGLLRRAGLSGWDVVAVIPRTVGIGLANRRVDIGTDVWGAGMGGNVAGVYLVLKMEVTSNLSDAFLSDYIERNIKDIMG